ncbi:uncharacterized protein N7479_001265 [Penicillium vulpinum]|uniref:uncharacterized protein n=1 Tax=Penicillium vulpinum TaxID=29845 RepID=UPI0025471521|nr:uncharacterized protein N7479_001265 [Penicillium vulpinum]KAJ5971347.1 hypothetical protein N7479_001265 [Penicillium vulpinum]
MGHDIYKRAIIVACKANGVNTTTLSEQVGLQSKAIENGFDPESRPWNISDAMLADAPRSGRPTKQSSDVKSQVLLKAQLGQEKSCADIAEELSLEGLDISSSTVWRILKDAGLSNTRPTRKPPLSKAVSTSTRQDDQPANPSKASDSGSSS